MAIISIPTSIGGVSIPGNIINGPLGALFGNKFGINSYQYPRDLGSATKGHIVQFSVNEIDPITYEEAKKFINKSTSIEGLKEQYSSVKNFFSGDAQKTLNFKPKKKRKVATISLYIPDTLNFQYNAGYGNLSLVDVANEVAGAVNSVVGNKPILGTIAKAGSLGLTVAQSNAAKLALSTQGLAINPQQQLLFEGIDFRTYQMAFTFTPYSRQEAEAVKEIIKLFRYHAAPQITTAAAGMFFVPPSTFDLDFLFNGQRNNNVTRVAESVIESIDVNYAPNGWSAHDDGAPVQTTLTMNFKEIELIDKDKIKAGY
ncbi:MAG: hypothetical protein ACOYNN_13645 [Terrimicrobiaceae bacterium]|jgi:hypothetical protein